MNGPDILTSFRTQLADVISAQFTLSLPPEPSPISPWLAMSLLQKAIRRGEEQLALQAGATLLKGGSERVWRRLGCIAFEDIGLADFETAALVTAAIGSKKFRTSLGGEWLVARYLIGRLAQAPKSRSADDLLMTAEQHPAFERDRLRLTFRSLDELLRIVTGDDPLHRRALALWYALGTDRRPSEYLRERRGNPNAVFDHLCEAGYPETLIEIARESFIRTGEILAPLVALLFPLHGPADRSVADDDLPPTIICGPVPGWVLDVYSREGQSTLRKFLRTSCPTAKWLRANVHPERRVRFLGELVFRVEGGLLRRREQWSQGDNLRRMFEIECLGPECTDASALLDMMRDDLDVLNGVRRHAV